MEILDNWYYIEKERIEDLKKDIITSMNIEERKNLDVVVCNYFNNHQEIEAIIKDTRSKIEHEVINVAVEKINLAANKMLIEFNSIDKIQSLINEIEVMKERMDALYFEMHSFMREMKESAKMNFKNFKD